MSLSRRTALKRAALLAGATALTVTSAPQALAAGPVPSPPALDPALVQDALDRHRAEQRRVFTGRPSKNGWEMERVADAGGTVWTRPVVGTPLAGVRVRLGDVETVLVHVVRRFHYEVDALRAGDVAGWSAPSKVRKGLAESNLASGTAVRIRPGSYPFGARGGFFPDQLLVIRDILAELAGVVRWGGDDRRPDEALFYVDVRPGDPRLAEVARTLRGWSDEPGKGAGAPVDVLGTRRRDAAEALARRQRAAA
ncbi:hypothetical protein [Streptomyces sp. NPDC050528]|uniref:hypothetical protein n=1 Tax=Streptomyces sp. NPDC050528 TaxID=3365623 RepID=UPI0037B98B5C